MQIVYIVFRPWVSTNGRGSTNLDATPTILIGNKLIEKSWWKIVIWTKFCAIFVQIVAFWECPDLCGYHGSLYGHPLRSYQLHKAKIILKKHKIAKENNYMYAVLHNFWINFCLTFMDQPLWTKITNTNNW